jgi:MoaA/NifB/PqqE/SkfB family radical SAM enzyme
MEGYFDLKVGFSCNNNCIHCVITDKKGTKDLTTQEIKDIINKVPEGLMVGFTGGEATIRPDFLELAAYAKQKGHQVALQTNGTQFADWEFAVGASKLLDNVLIAIHSHLPETHNAIVRGIGMYEKTIQGFKNIIKLGIDCSTQTVISKLNINDLPKTYDFIQELKPGIKMSLTYPHPNGNAWNNADAVCPSYTEIKDIIQEILAKHAPNLRTEAIPMCYLYPYQDEISVNFDEHLADDDRRGMDPANRGNDFFDKDGMTTSYTASIMSEKRKGPRCAQCIFNDRCVGVWKEYVALYKNQFDLYPVLSSTTESPCEDDCCCEEEVIPNNESPKINTNWGALIIYGSEKRCMNRCVFCEGEHFPEGADEKFKRYMEEAKYFIDTGVQQIEISGGDPGEYARLPEVITYLKQNGISRIQLSTHGRTLKDENFVIALKEAGISSIKVPLYGSTAEIHNKTAAPKDIGGDPFKDSTEGLKNCVKHGIPVKGYTLVNRYNKEDINNIIQLYLDLAPELLLELHVGLAFIAKLNYEYTDSWYLPVKELGPYIKEVYNNHPAIPENVRFGFLDIPYCVFGEYTDMTENKFEGFPNLGLHKVEKENRSEVEGIPHYRIKSYFGECAHCDLSDICGAVPLNEIKMFGVYGLKGIKE